MYLYEPLQFAYKTLRSTKTAFIIVHNDILLSVDSGHNVILVLLVMSAAFDTVNHEILLTRLHQHFGISDTALNWLKITYMIACSFSTSSIRGQTFVIY